MLPELWFIWGLGWLFMPRMTIGLILLTITPFFTTGLVLSIIGAILDIGAWK